MQRLIIASSFVLGLLASLTSAAPPSHPSQDAWPLYDRAIQRVEQGYRQNIMSPAASSLTWSGSEYPPAWHKMEKESYAFNAPARALVHEARSRQKANWPSQPLAGKEDFRYLNGCRAVANEVADAAIQEHLLGNDAAAVESIRDLLHLSHLLDDSRAPSMIRPLVALGVRMVAMDRLETITADVALTDDPADSRKLQVGIAKDLIRRLFDINDPAPRYADLLRREIAGGKTNTTGKERFLTQMRRGQMENNLASMSLACHLFRFDKHRWPASLQELTTYLPAPPRDAWGAMSYAIVKSDKPNGRDRPLVYSRCNSKDGLFYPVNEPQFSYYPGFGSGDHRKQGGQFRDVTFWNPTDPNAPPTTRPLR